ncbi:MAG: hypothetical protein AAB411_02325 [Patescibacteria group bacterium]
MEILVTSVIGRGVKLHFRRFAIIDDSGVGVEFDKFNPVFYNV